MHHGERIACQTVADFDAKHSEFSPPGARNGTAQHHLDVLRPQLPANFARTGRVQGKDGFPGICPSIIEKQEVRSHVEQWRDPVSAKRYGNFHGVGVSLRQFTYCKCHATLKIAACE